MKNLMQKRITRLERKVIELWDEAALEKDVQKKRVILEKYVQTRRDYKAQMALSA